MSNFCSKLLISRILAQNFQKMGEYSRNEQLPFRNFPFRLSDCLGVNQSTKNVDDSKAATSGDHKNPGSITENTYTMYACLLFQDKAALITIG